MSKILANRFLWRGLAFLRLALPLCLAICSGEAAEPAQVSAPATAQAPVDFARDVQPIFIKRCYECHGPDKQKNDLRLDHKQDAFRGGKSGKPLVVPGQSSASE